MPQTTPSLSVYETVSSGSLSKTDHVLTVNSRLTAFPGSFTM